MVVQLFISSWPLWVRYFVPASGQPLVFGLNYAFVCFPFDSCDLLRCSRFTGIAMVSASTCIVARESTVFVGGAIA